MSDNQITLTLSRAEALRFLVALETTRDSVPTKCEEVVDLVLATLEAALLGPE